MLLHHPDATVTKYLLSILNGSSFFGRIMYVNPYPSLTAQANSFRNSGGYVSDKIGGLNLLYPTTIINGALCLTLWLLGTTVSSVTAFVCLYGFFSGIFISVIPPVAAHISPDDKIGARLGALSSVCAIGVFTGTPIGGALLSHGTSQDFEHLIVYGGATMIAAGLLLLATRILCDRNLRSKW